MNRNSGLLRRAVLLGAGLGALTINSSGAPFGRADPSFNPPRFTARVYPGHCYSDGRGGLLWSFVNTTPSGFVGANGVRVGGLVRTSTNGILDPSFIVGPALRDTIGVAVQADLKVLVGGRLVGDLAPNGAPNYRVFRLLTNGTLDATYHSPVFGGSPYYLKVQPDGESLAALLSLSDTPAPNWGIVDFARLNIDGSQDTNFHRPAFTGGVAGIFALPVIDTNGAIYVAGGFTSVDGQSRQNIARLNPGGTLDQSFVPTGFTSISIIRGILLQPGGKVVIAGRFRMNSDYYPLLRLNSDGSLDNSFTLVSAGSINFVRARLLSATADAKMLTVGGNMARFNSDGSLDNSFTRLPFYDASGTLGATALWFEQLPDGAIVVPSDPSVGPAFINGQPFNGAIRLLPNGSLDAAFSQPTFQQDVFPTIVARQSNQQLLVAGSFDHVGSNRLVALTRLNTDGTPDLGYTLTVSNMVSGLNLAISQSNQTYALLQPSDLLTQAPSNIVARLQSDGSMDPAFNWALASNYSGEYFFPDLLLQRDLPIIVGSRVQALLAQTNAPVLRLLTDGRADSSFQPDFTLPGSGTDASGNPITDWNNATIDDIGNLVVSDLQLLAAGSDGKLLAAIGTYVSAARYNYQIVRLNTNGTLDASFSGVRVSYAGSVSLTPVVIDRQGSIGQVLATYPVRCLAGAVILPDGGLLFGGSFTNVEGAFRPGIARLKSDYSMDPNFPAGSGPATAGGLSPVKISGLSLDGAGKVWISGNFVQWDGISAPGYVRLNPDGSVDAKSNPQSTHYAVDDYNPVSFSGTLPEGTNLCYVFGPNLLQGDLWPRSLTRLVSYLPPPLVVAGMLPGQGFRISFNSESNEPYWLQTSSDLQSWSNWMSFGGTGQQLFFTDPTALSLPQKFYRVEYQQ